MKHVDQKQFQEWWVALIVALLAWLWIFPKVLVGLHWHDTSEFIAASRTLAVSHPPGHPLTLIFMHIAQGIPFFDCAERSHLASSFWGALGAGIMYLGLFELLADPKRLESIKDKVLARISLVMITLSSICLPLVVLQLTRAEVYAPQWACTIVVWYSLFYAQKHNDERAYLWAAFFLGLLSSNHTLLALALIWYFPKVARFKIKPQSVELKCFSLFACSQSLFLPVVPWYGRRSNWMGWVVDLKAFGKLSALRFGRYKLNSAVLNLSGMIILCVCSPLL